MNAEFQIGQLWGIILAAGDGVRVRDFLVDLCGGRGIKQFCAVIGRRSMLEHTLARAERLIPRKRIVIVVSRHHCEEVAQQLAHWPAENVIFQPENRDTTAGVLLPLACISHRDPLATVAIFPSDHFVLQEGRFMDAVRREVWETRRFPWNLTLLGMQPDCAEEGYGWILSGEPEKQRETRAVRGFWEKPTLAQAQDLWRDGALWNTFVCIAQSGALWGMVRRAAAEVHERFGRIRQALGASSAERIIEQTYSDMLSINFCSGVCEPLAAELRVLPVPPVGWSDWGTVERIRATLEQLGRQAEFLARLNRRKSV